MHWITSFVKRTADQKDGKKRVRDYFLFYTVFFLLSVPVIFSPFLWGNKSFIFHSDGIMQHYPALVYYGRWLRSIVKTIFMEGRLILPEWDFSIGYGADVITTLHYYCIGDPLALLSAFVPGRYTEYLYNLLCIVRLYLAGVAFSCFCFRMKKGRVAAMAGAFSYIFCAYALVGAIRHPYFVNPMIYLPLLLVGVERIFHREKPALFMGMVCLSAVSNFYFFYMLVFAVIFYVIVRYFTLPHGGVRKRFVVWMAEFAGYGAVGVAMGAVILLPVILFFLGGLRNTAEVSRPLFYSIGYYGKMIARMLTADTIGHWTWIGITGPGLLSIFLLFSQKGKRKALKVSFCILSIFLLLPVFGSALNGFNYAVNRWIWIYLALCSYILVEVWPDFFSMGRREIVILCAGSGGYLLLLFVLNRRYAKESSFAGAALMLAALTLLSLYRSGCKDRVKRAAPFCVLAVVLIHTCVNGYYCYDPGEGDRVSQFIDGGIAYKEKTKNHTRAMRPVFSSEDGFGRYESSEYDFASKNADMLAQTHGVSFYWSLANGHVSQFLLDMSCNDFCTYKFYGNNYRTFLNAAASVKYFVAPFGYTGAVPFGYEKIWEEISVGKNRYAVYENRYALPLGYTYNSYISYEDYSHMTAPERQEALLQGVILGDGTMPEIKGNLSAVNPLFSEKEVEYEVVCGKNVVRQEDGSFISGKAGTTITLEFQGLENCETYLYLRGADISYKTKRELYLDGDSDIYPREKYARMSIFKRLNMCYEDCFESKWQHDTFFLDIGSGQDVKQLLYMTPYNRSYTGQKDFLVNLGYRPEARTSITITFPERGVYHFEDMKIICQPMDAYVKQAKLLTETVLENEKIGTDEISGTIRLDKDKFLCLSVPYSKGWRAYVDGVETDLIRANIMYMGILLEAGEHTVRLVYHTHGLWTGLAVSVMGCMLFLGIHVFHRKKISRAAAGGKAV